MLLDGMDGTLKVQCSTWLIVSSSVDQSSEETRRYLRLLHPKDSTFPVATMPRMLPDLGVEAQRPGTTDIRSWLSHANKLASCEAADQDLDSPADPCRVSSNLAGQECGAGVYAGTSLLGSAEGRTADSATISTVLYADSGCAGFVLRVTNASSCTDFLTVFNWKVALFPVHRGSAMDHLGMDIFSLVGDMEAVRIRASQAGVLALHRALVREMWTTKSSPLWGARDPPNRSSINHRSRSTPAKTVSRAK